MVASEVILLNIKVIQYYQESNQYYVALYPQNDKLSTLLHPSSSSSSSSSSSGIK